MTHTAKREVDSLVLQHVRQFLSLSCRGQAAAQTKEVIASEIGLIIQARHDSARATTRMVELAVEYLRQNHAPIVSGSKGYYWTDSAAELRKCRHSLIRRAVQQLRNARAMLPAELDLAGQQHIPATKGRLFA